MTDEIYQELEIWGPRKLLESTITEIEGLLKEGWVRSPDLEDKNPIGAPLNRVLYCFSCDKRNQRLAADLWLQYKDDGTLYVSNVIPTEKRLSVEQYNLIVEDFYKRFVQPVAQKFGLENSFFKPVFNFVIDTGQDFNLFPNLTDQSASMTRPFDQQQWLSFLVSAHIKKADLNTEELAAMLIRKGWHEDTIADLIQEFEFAKTLLTFYDKHRSRL